MISNAKVLKICRKVAPHIRWMRQNGHDLKDDAGVITQTAFAGVLGKSGIRFGVGPEDPVDLVEAKATRVAQRLIRGE